MELSSSTFIFIFLPIFALLYSLFKNKNVKSLLMIAAGVCFYSFGDLSYLVIFVLTAVFTWLIGFILSKVSSKGGKKVISALGVITVVSMLCFFKYGNFLLKHLSLPFDNIIMPLGISFFTFKSISYIVDCYRGQVDTKGNFVKVMVYMTFFPQIISGPIADYESTIKYIQNPQMSLSNTARGLRRFIFGLFKKLVLADTLAVAVNAMYSIDSAHLGTFAAWLGAVGFALQLYLDFSGYCDMSIGVSRMLGYISPENFDYPYISTSVTEFWRRWHITLSLWFKKYIYFPLGGSRCSKARAVFNRMVVFALTGIWHGTGATFLFWGLMHGVAVSAESLFPKAKKNWQKVICYIYTMLFVVTTFAVFRADSLSQGFAFIGSMFKFSSASLDVAYSQLSPYFVVVLLFSMVISLPVINLIKKNKFVKNHKGVFNDISYVASLLLLIVCIAQLASSNYSPFIYAKF